MGTSVGALKASTERFEDLKMRSLPRVISVRSVFVYSRSVLVNEHREGGIVRTQEVFERAWESRTRSAGLHEGLNIYGAGGSIIICNH